MATPLIEIVGSIFIRISVKRSKFYLFNYNQSKMFVLSEVCANLMNFGKPTIRFSYPKFQMLGLSSSMSNY